MTSPREVTPQHMRHNSRHTTVGGKTSNINFHTVCLCTKVVTLSQMDCCLSKSQGVHLRPQQNHPSSVGRRCTHNKGCNHAETVHTALVHTLQSFLRSLSLGPEQTHTRISHRKQTSPYRVIATPDARRQRRKRKERKRVLALSHFAESQACLQPPRSGSR